MLRHQGHSAMDLWIERSNSQNSVPRTIWRVYLGIPSINYLHSSWNHSIWSNVLHLRRELVGWIKLVPRLTYRGSLRASHWRVFMRRHLSRPLVKSLKERLICPRWIPKPILRRSMERAGKLGLLNWLSRARQFRYLSILCKHSGWFKQLPLQWAFLYHCKTFLWRHLKHPDGVFRDERWRSIASIHWAILRWWMEWTRWLGLRSSWDLTVPLLELCVLCKHSRWSKPVP